MGLPRRKPDVSPHDRAMAFWVKSARPPKQDETEAIALAKEFGADIEDVLELVCERRAIRQYEGNLSREDADRLGLEDARVILAAKAVRRDRSR